MWDVGRLMGGGGGGGIKGTLTPLLLQLLAVGLNPGPCSYIYAGVPIFVIWNYFFTILFFWQGELFS